MAKPSTLPRWAMTAGGAEAANVVAPTSGEQDAGWGTGGAIPSSGKTNWLLRWITQWLSWLNGVFETGNAGLEITAPTGVPGVKAAGSTARAALNLVPVGSDPASPADGDVWATTAGAIKAKLNGVVKALLTPDALTPTWTNIATNANLTAANGLAYTKDAQGWVCMKGKMTWIGAANGSFFAFPAGYRPPADLDLIVYGLMTAQNVAVVVSVQASTGAVFFGAAQGQTVSPFSSCPFDMTGVRFYAG
jgi:hypothetical protein